ncbi:MAG TPA: hypothetical protein VLE44_03500 [Candidatus Saccharimonadales bacterium]|nr:hypothetical protein [Candidatus Saccharimonadales bacterium]
MVEILGRDISQEKVAQRVSDWEAKRLEKGKPIRPEVVVAIEAFATEIIMPNIFVEDDQLFIRGSGDEEQSKRILKGLTKGEKLIARGTGHRIAFEIGREVLERDTK